MVLAELPPLARLGLAVLLAGGLGDLGAHALAAGHDSAEGHTAAELAGHLVAFTGMVLVLLGVVLDGARQAIARRRSAGPARRGVS